MQRKTNFKIKEIYKNNNEKDRKVTIQKLLNNVIKKFFQY